MISLLNIISSYLSRLDTLVSPDLDPVLAIFCSFLLIYICHFLKIFLILLSKNKYLATAPRNQWSQKYLVSNSLSKAAQRVEGAHYNSIEVFTSFSVAVLCALFYKVNIMVLSSLSTLFVFSRIIYIIAYIIASKPFLVLFRTITFMFGILCIARIFLLTLGY